MSEIMERRVQARLEQRIQEKIIRERRDMALSFIKLKKVTLEDIAMCTGLPLEEVKELAKEQSA